MAAQSNLRVVENSMDKSKALDAALSQIERAFGKGSIMKLGASTALEIEATPGEAWCMPCGATVPLAQVGEPCPRCGGYQLEVTRGEDMRVRDIAID